MRRKRVELEQAVIAAARKWHQAGWPPVSLVPETNLCDAIVDLNEYEASEIVDSAGRWVEGSPETSQHAAITAAPMLGSVRRSIIDEIRIAEFHHLYGRSDDELETILKRKHTTVSSARNWLCNTGWLYDAGWRRDTAAGNPAVVWVLTPAAHEALR